MHHDDAQIELFGKTDESFDEDGKLTVQTVPKHVDEKFLRLHLDALGVALAELTRKRAEYLGVDAAGL